MILIGYKYDFYCIMVSLRNKLAHNFANNLNKIHAGYRGKRIVIRYKGAY